MVFGAWCLVAVDGDGGGGGGGGGVARPPPGVVQVWLSDDGTHMDNIVCPSCNRDCWPPLAPWDVCHMCRGPRERVVVGSRGGNMWWVGEKEDGEEEAKEEEEGEKEDGEEEAEEEEEDEEEEKGRRRVLPWSPTLPAVQPQAAAHQ